MTIKIQQIVAALLFLTVMPLTAQVLWSDDFDSYPTGALSSAPTAQDGWYYSAYNNVEAQIVSEPGRGKVLAIGWTTASQNNEVIRNREIEALWNTRTTGNDVMKLEYDFYAEDFSLLSGNYFQSTVQPWLLNSIGGGDVLGQASACRVSSTESYLQSGSTYPTTNHRTDYDHTWIKVEVYLDYDAGTNYMFTYIPSLNHLAITEYPANNDVFQPSSIRIYFNADQVLHSGALVKYDNFKLSALPTRPSHLKVNDFVASKFNVFPNPVTDVVTITNSENIGVEEIEIFDISGKKVQSQNFSKENEVQLNLGDFAAGTYLLHIKTNEGTAVEKVVKK